MAGVWIIAVIALTLSAVALGVALGGLRRSPSPPDRPLLPPEFFVSQQGQADAMRLMAERTAEGLRAANGTYVFALRDRFDEALPAAQLGVADTSWTALGEAPGAVEELVLHPGDAVRFSARLVCNQAVGRRRVQLRWLSADGVNPVDASILTASGRIISADGGELSTDTTAFIELPVDVVISDDDVASACPLDRSATAELVLTDNRPEGAVVTHTIVVRVRGYLQPDDDGVAIETPAVEVAISDEHRAWFLDKASDLALALPGQRAS